MKRTPLSRGKLARCCGRHASLCTCGEPPRLKRSRLNPVNRERRERVRGDDVYGSYWKWASAKPCILRDHPNHECVGESPAHHRETVGNGGKDWANCIPCCAQLHAEMHASETKVEERYGIDLRLIAAGLAERYEREHGSDE